MVRFVRCFWPELLYQLDDSGRSATHVAVSERRSSEEEDSVPSWRWPPGMVGAADFAGRLLLPRAVDHESMLTYGEKDRRVGVGRTTFD
jgi:hypothetical protein